MLLRPYSLMGTRADSEFLLWQIAEQPGLFQQLATAVVSTAIGGYLETVQSYFSQTKRSVYEIPVGEDGDDGQLLVEAPTAKYVFVYPFVKKRSWYGLDHSERQAMMEEHIKIGRSYPSVRVNTTYCYGLDDYEFIVAFEADDPSDFLDLVQELRGTRASSYTERDTPNFSAMGMGLAEVVDSLGGPPIAESKLKISGPKWISVCDAADLAPGERRVAFLEDRQVAIFHVGGRPLAISNRCSHSRGPLSDGDLGYEGGVHTVTCPWHDACFDLATGEVVSGIAAAPVEIFPVKIEDGYLYVRSTPVAPEPAVMPR